MGNQSDYKSAFIHVTANKPQATTYEGNTFLAQRHKCITTIGAVNR